MNYKRVNITMPHSAHKNLEKLQTRMEAESLSQTIRTVLEDYDTLLTAVESGARVILRHSNGTESLVPIGPSRIYDLPAAKDPSVVF